MKRILACLSAVTLAVMVTSCEKKEEQKKPEIVPEIKLTDDSLATGISLDEGEASTTVAFTSNVPWSATVSAAWIKISPSSGKSGKNSIAVQVKENDTEKERNAAITIADNSSRTKVSVALKQAGKKAIVFTVDIDKVSVPAEGGDFKVSVTHNIDYEIESAPDWISQEDKTTEGDRDTYTFKAKANKAFQERSGVIVFHNELDESVPVNVTQAEAVPTNIVFEDANFKAYMVANFDKDNDGEISFEEALDITKVNVKTDNIKSLAGIEYATNLKSLYCKGDEKGQLVRLDVSKNINLDTLVCGYNPLPALDVNNNTSLRYLDCRGAKLSSLDLSRNTKLTYLTLLFNELTSIDVSNCPDLEIFCCGENRLQSLDISKNTGLESLSCSNNKLTVLDLSSNTRLKALSCEKNLIVTLDITKNKELDTKSFFCFDNPMKSLYVNEGQDESLVSANIPGGVTVIVSSGKGAAQWANKEFWHKSLGLRFTATWCVFCPMMANAFAKAEKLYPNKIETFNLHARSSTYFFEETPNFEILLKCFSYPTANIDFRWQVDNQTRSDDTAGLLVNAVKETEWYYPTKSGISFSSSVSGNELKLNVKLYLKERGDYKLAAFLLEDGLIGYQEGTGGLIEHNSIARLAISDAEGDAFSTPEDKMTVLKNYTAVIPDKCDKKNLRVLVYVFRKYGTKTIIRTADYGEYYVDNATSAALGSKKELAFTDGSTLGGNEDTKDGGEIILK